jgi:MoaA/NifB/PqqE/SkfB family radical SAM enzyme
LKTAIVQLVRKVITPGYLRWWPDLFQSGLPRERRRLLFQRFAKMVEVEVHSYCNRACWFCPNSFIDRRSRRIYLDERVYLGLLRDLGSTHYPHMISYSRYNEPLADEIIYGRIRQARELAPQALLHTHTNGDWVDAQSLERLHAAGLRSMHIMVYPPTDVFDNAAARDLAATIARRAGVEFRLRQDVPDEKVWYVGRYKEMHLEMYAKNWRRIGTNRGGIAVTSHAVRREIPCEYPMYGVYIDYNGQVMPCCNLRSDNPDETQYSCGQLTADNSIFDIFGGDPFAAFRRRMYGFGEKAGPCLQCTFSPAPRNALNRWLSRARQSAILPPEET